MDRAHSIFAITSLAAICVGCSQQSEKTAGISAAPALPSYVPSTSMVQPKTAEPQPTALAFQVLPGANDDYFFVGRPEKAIYTTLPLSEISAFSIFVYDAQRISLPHSSGYRYTWHVKEGVSSP
jgi:hypothetical protein